MFGVWYLFGLFCWVWFLRMSVFWLLAISLNCRYLLYSVFLYCYRLWFGCLVVRLLLLFRWIFRNLGVLRFRLMLVGWVVNLGTLSFLFLLVWRFVASLAVLCFVVFGCYGTEFWVLGGFCGICFVWGVLSGTWWFWWFVLFLFVSTEIWVFWGVCLWFVVVCFGLFVWFRNYGI